MKEKFCSQAFRNTVKNICFIIVILLLAAAIWLGYAISTGKAPVNRRKAVVSYTAAGQTYTIALPMDQNQTYSIVTGTYTVHIQIQDGAAAFVDSPCPDHLCEEFGWLREEHAWAACAPAGAFLQIEKAA